MARFLLQNLTKPTRYRRVHTIGSTQRKVSPAAAIGSPSNFWRGSMKIQGFWRRPAVAILAATLGLSGMALVAADKLGMLNPPATMKFASPDEPASRNTFAPVVKKVLPAVVSVSSSKMVKTGFDQGDGEMDPLF